MPVTTAVILAGGQGRRFGVLTSRDVPRALLPLANAPLLSYPVDWVAASGLQEALIVAGARFHRAKAGGAGANTRFCTAGEAVAAAISRWVSEEYKGPCKLTVVGACDSRLAIVELANALTVSHSRLGGEGRRRGRAARHLAPRGRRSSGGGQARRRARRGAVC